MAIIKRRTSPVDYRQCNQTVTIYRWDGKDTYTTKVIHNAFFERKHSKNVDKLGGKDSDTFLLIVPGATVPVEVGDKVLNGEGEEISTREAWAALIPSKTPGLVIVEWVAPKYWRGAVVHTEAGG